MPITKAVNVKFYHWTFLLPGNFTSYTLKEQFQTTCAFYLHDFSLRFSLLVVRFYAVPVIRMKCVKMNFRDIYPHNQYCY